MKDEKTSEVLSEDQNQHVLPVIGKMLLQFFGILAGVALVVAVLVCLWVWHMLTTGTLAD